VFVRVFLTSFERVEPVVSITSICYVVSEALDLLHLRGVAARVYFVINFAKELTWGKVIVPVALPR
jgi:hypothetical protein